MNRSECYTWLAKNSFIEKHDFYFILKKQLDEDLAKKTPQMMCRELDLLVNLGNNLLATICFRSSMV